MIFLEVTLRLSGTFTARDTYLGELKTPISQNRYTYAHNNPVRYTDPSGHRLDVDGPRGPGTTSPGNIRDSYKPAPSRPAPSKPKPSGGSGSGGSAAPSGGGGGGGGGGDWEEPPYDPYQFIRLYYKSMVQRPGAASGTFAKTTQQYKTLLANAAKQSVKQKETAKGSWWDKTTTSLGNWYANNKTEIWTTAAYVGLGVLAVGLTVATAGAGSAVAGTILAGALTGASISAGIDAGTQYLQNDHSFDNYNPMQTLRASSVGAVSGALGGSALSLRAEVIGNAILQAVNTFGTSVATGKEATATDYLVHTAAGAVAGFAGGAGVQHASATGDQVVHYIGSSYPSYANNAGLETISIFSNQIPDAAYNAVIRSGILSNFVQEQTESAISNIRNK